MDEKLTAALEAIDGCCFWIECIITEGMKREGKVNPLLAEGLDLRNSIFNQLMKSENGKKRKNDINSGRK